MCNNLCTVLGKNAPNGYTEIHQSILNSYSTFIFYGNFGFLHMGPKSFEFCSIIKDHRVPGIRSVMRQCHEQSVAFLWWTSKNNQNGAPYNEPQISFFPGYWYKYRYTMVPNMHLEKRPDWPGTAWIAWSLNLWPFVLLPERFSTSQDLQGLEGLWIQYF